MEKDDFRFINGEGDGTIQNQPSLSPEEAALELARAVREEGVHINLTDGYLDATYEVKKAIGKGKFSTVYKAVRRADELVVALKQVAFFDTLDSKSRLKCLKELKLVQTLEHPNIIRYLDGFLEGNVLYLVFEYAEAGDLKRQIRKAREREARFDERVVWKYFSQIAEAVAYMHSERAMHRDLKPANIFLTLEGQVKVGDLGLGRFLSEETLAAESRVGTPLYMSPEVLRGHGYDWSSDVWSLGCLLYELAMLRNPFKEEGLNLYGLFAKISEGQYSPPSSVYSETLRSLVDACLQLEPAARPTAEQVAAVAVDMREQLMRNRTPSSVSTSRGEGAGQAQAQTMHEQHKNVGHGLQAQERRTPSPAMFGTPVPMNTVPSATPTARGLPVPPPLANAPGLAIGRADRRGPVVAEHWPDLGVHVPDDASSRHAVTDRLRTSPVSLPSPLIHNEGPASSRRPARSEARGIHAGAQSIAVRQQSLEHSVPRPSQATPPLYLAASIMDLFFTDGALGVLHALQHTLHSTVSMLGTTDVPLRAILHDSLVDVFGGPAAVHARTGPGRAPSTYDLVLHVLHVSTQSSFLMADRPAARAPGAPSEVQAALVLLGAVCAAVLSGCGLRALAAVPLGSATVSPGTPEQHSDRQELALWLRAVLSGHESDETLWSILLQSLLPVALQHVEMDLLSVPAASQRLRPPQLSIGTEWVQLQAGLGVNPRSMVASHAKSQQLPCMLLWMMQILLLCCTRAQVQQTGAIATAGGHRPRDVPAEGSRNQSPDDTEGQLDGYEDDFEEASAAVHERTAVHVQGRHPAGSSAASGDASRAGKEADEDEHAGKAAESANQETLSKLAREERRLSRHRSGKSDE